MFWKFGSEEGRKEVAQAAESRERFFVLNLFIFKYWGQGGCLFFQNEGDLGMLEEVASEVKTLKIVRTPGNQTSKEYRVEGGVGDCAVSTASLTVSLSAETCRL